MLDWIPLSEPHRLPAVCGLYLIRHRESGREYVGKSVNVRRRAREHRHARAGVTYLYRAIRKHGVEAFDICLLAIGTEEAMTQLEVETIAARGTFNPAGYNQTRGGDGVSGYRYTETQRAAVTARQLGRPVTEEAKAKMREARLANNPFKGQKHSPEALAKIAEASRRQAGKPRTEAQKAHMQRLSAAKIGKPGPQMSAEAKQRLSAARKGVPRPAGFGDRYMGQKNPMYGKRSPNAKVVLAWLPGSLTPLTFETAAIAANWAGCSIASMSAYCAGRQRANSGVQFAFA